MQKIINYAVFAIIITSTPIHAEPHINIPPVVIDNSGEISAPPMPQLPKMPIIKEDQPIGMKSLKATPSINNNNQSTQINTSKQNDTIKEQKISPLSSPMVDITKIEEKPRIYTLLTPKEALIPIDKLKPWGNISATALGSSKSDAINIIKAIESDRGAVPPQGLFLAAKVLADNDMMNEAAVYYFVGQLRLSFDMLRWPAYNASKNGEIINPQSGISTLASSIGKPILHWFVKNPNEMERIITAVKAWELSANYAYDPIYETTHAIPFNEWENNLNAARTAYFGGIELMVKEIKKINPKS